MFQFVEPAHQETLNKSKLQLRQTKEWMHMKCTRRDAQKLLGNYKNDRSWLERGILLAVTKFPLVQSPCSVSGYTLCSENIRWSSKSSRGSIINGSESQECSSRVITPVEFKGVPALGWMHRASDWYSGISWCLQIRLKRPESQHVTSGQPNLLDGIDRSYYRDLKLNKQVSSTFKEVSCG